jgi:RecA-family ATPase
MSVVETPCSPRLLVDLTAALKLGIFNADTLKRYGEEVRSHFLIDGIIGERTVNLCVGNSGLGKTPLVVSMGIAVAAGVPWLGRPARQGRVLMCDGESSYTEFFEILTNVSGHLKLEGILDNFYVSSHWRRS